MNNKRVNMLVDLAKMALIVAISCALVLVIILLVSDEPGAALSSFFLGPLSSLRHIGNVIEAATPLMFTGLAVSIIFRAGQFSMISEGAFFLGGCGAMIAGISLDLPPVIHPVVCILLGAALGMAAAAVPALLKLWWDVSEMVSSIMLNYVCLFLTLYIMNYHYRDTATTAFQSLEVQETAGLPVIVSGTRIHLGLAVALVFCGLAWVFLFRSRMGYRLRVTGDNASFAKYVGIGATGVMCAAQLIAGAAAGTGGAVELLGMYSRFKWQGLPGYGWTGIMVALLAHRNPLAVPLSACFIAYLNVGAAIMSRSSDVASEVISVIQGVILLLIASEALLDGWRQRMIVKAAEQEDRAAQPAAEGEG